MKNVTLALDEATLREARRIAAERSTTVNAMVRDFLERLTARESHARKARQRIAELCRDLDGRSRRAPLVTRRAP